MTLIEIVVSVAILAMLAGLAANNFKPMRTSQTVRQGALSLKAKLIQAQSLALSPPNDNGKAVAYGVKITNANPFRYQIYQKISDTLNNPYPNVVDVNAQDRLDQV